MGQYNGDFFQTRLDALVDLNHELAILSTLIPWAQLEAALSPLLTKQKRPILVAADTKSGLLFVPTAPGVQGSVVSPAGRPRLSIRLMCSLIYLKHLYHLSDEALCARWSENVAWQYFSGAEIYAPKQPCDPTQIGRFRTAIGEAGVEAILKATIDTAIEIHAIKPAEFERVIVDTTVQEKAISFPRDARVLDIARRKVVNAAQRAGISLRQTFAKEGASLLRRAGGYAHARQFKRLARMTKRQKTILGVLHREIERALAKRAKNEGTTTLQNAANWASTDKAPTPAAPAASIPPPAAASTAPRSRLPAAPESAEALSQLKAILERAERVRLQEKHTSNKLYAMHAPEVECISKGKARNRYEFGVKVSLAVTHKQGLIVGAKRFVGNPHDGHTLSAQIAQCNGLTASAGRVVKEAVVDLGYRGMDADNLGVRVMHRGTIKSMTKTEKKILKRRQAIEPVIGHVKHDHGMLRCHLKGSIGDALHAVCCAAGFNMGWLLRAIKRMGLKGLFAALSWLLWLRHTAPKPTVYRR